MKDNRTSQTGSPRFHGIIPPLVTPLRPNRELDIEGLERLIEHVISGGVHGVFMLGSTGEAPSLSQRARRELVDHACRIVRGRVPVVVGITDTAFEESVDLARHAAKAGAAALVVTAPFYYLIGQAELTSYLEHLVAELPLPVLLYNIPKLTKVELETETVRRMMGIERVVGIKDSSGDLKYLQELLSLAKDRRDWSVLVGDEILLVDTVTRGGHGGVMGGANYYPQLYSRLYEATAQGNVARQAALVKELSALSDIHRVGTYVSGGIRGIKFALSLMGICGDGVAEPLMPLDDSEKERVRAALAKTELLKR
jgi:4-hydroxy-tetrahydrodipicolinate synthase